MQQVYIYLKGDCILILELKIKEHKKGRTEERKEGKKEV
jgi:hypothetical protein